MGEYPSPTKSPAPWEPFFEKEFTCPHCNVTVKVPTIRKTMTLALRYPKCQHIIEIRNDLVIFPTPFGKEFNPSMR
jgi:transcription elongation factor Elf1